MFSSNRHVESGKDILRHIASRDTSWPEYCLSAVDELTAAVRELSIPQNPPRRHTSAPNIHPRSTGVGPSNRPENSPSRTRTLRSDNAVASSSHLRARFSPSVAASSGRPDDQVPVPAEGISWTQSQGETVPGSDDAARWAAQTSPASGPSLNNAAWSAGTPGGGQPGLQSMTQQQQDSPGFDAQQSFSLGLGAASFPSAAGGAEAAPGEGQESMVWYDQLFANSFGAIDYPFLAAAQFDSSVDPTWAYLR